MILFINHPNHFTISPFHHFTISPFHHFTISPFHHFITSSFHNYHSLTSRCGKTRIRYSPYPRPHRLQGLLRHATTSTYSPHQPIHLPPRRSSSRHRCRRSWSRPPRPHLRHSLPSSSHTHHLRTSLWPYGTCGRSRTVSLAGEHTGEKALSDHPQPLEDAYRIPVIPLWSGVESHVEGLREEGKRD